MAPKNQQAAEKHKALLILNSQWLNGSLIDRHIQAKLLLKNFIFLHLQD